jgi:hypothetical protein
MAHPFTHAEGSARKFGGKAEDYLATHPWFDESKAFFTSFRHRAAAANRNPKIKVPKNGMPNGQGQIYPR